MRPLCAITLVVLTTLAAQVRADEPSANPDLHAARRVGLTLALTVVEKLEAGDQEKFPGIKAWLADFRKATKGIDPKGDAAKWPAFDADAVLTRNPHFWQLYYEIAPADPGLALLQAGLLLFGGEVNRAMYLAVVYAQRPGVPAAIRDMFEKIIAAFEAVAKRPNELIQAGTELHDAGDFEAALKKYRAALDLWPQYGLAYYESGLSRHHLNLSKAGKKPPPANAPPSFKDPMHAAEVTADFARARRHDPLQLNAYQGADQEVITGFRALATKGIPVWRKLAPEWKELAPDKPLAYLGDAFQEAQAHELALAVRSVLAARRGRYVPEDHAFLSKSLKKLAPGEATEATLKKLAGEAMAVRQLIAPEAEKRKTAPEKEKPKNSAAFEVKQVVLYVRPQELESRVGGKVDPHADYMKKVWETAAAHWADVPKGRRQTMLLIVGIKPGKTARFWYTFGEGGVKDEVLAALTKKIEALPAPEVKRPMLAALQVDLWGGPEQAAEGPPPESLHFPKAWLDAAKAKGVTLRIPLGDDEIKLIWP